MFKMTFKFLKNSILLVSLFACEKNNSNFTRQKNSTEVSTIPTEGNATNNQQSSTPGGSRSDNINSGDNSNNEEISSSGSTGTTPIDMIPAESRELRRLTAVQYVNTIKNIFDIDISSELSSFPLEGSVFGFQNSYDAFGAGPSQIEWFSSTAAIISERVVQNLSGSNLKVCLEGKDFSCAENQIGEYKNLLLRGQTDPALETVLDSIKTSGLANGTVANVLQNQLELLLQTPQFLYLLAPTSEGSKFVDRDNFDLATRLSLLIWNSLPDADLLDAASKGTFVRNLPFYIEKLANSPKARSGFRAYIKELLFLERLKTIEASPGYEHLTPSLIASMEKETLDFFEQIAFDSDKDFMDVFQDVAQSNDPELESLYTVDADGNPVSKADSRAGYLSQASFLTLTSLLVNTDPVARGHYVSKVFFCVHIPNPDLGVTPLEEQVTYTTKKQRYEAHSKNPTCAGCHIHMDRVGFAFEQFDKSGRFRTNDEYNNVVDASGVYQFFDEKEVAFKDFSDFNNKLLESEKVRQCLVKKTMEYALGYEVKPESSIFKSVYDEYIQTKKSYIDLLKIIAGSEAFKKVAGS